MRGHLYILAALAMAPAVAWVAPTSAQDAPLLTDQQPANGCIAGGTEDGRAGFRNTCDYAVTMQYCLTLRRGSSDVTCPTTKTMDVGPNGFAREPDLRNSERIYVFACNQAHRINDVVWSDAGFAGRCLG